MRDVMSIRLEQRGLHIRGLLPDPSLTGPEIVSGFESGSG